MRTVRPLGRDSLEAMLDRQVTALDDIMAEVRGGIRGARHYEQLEERASAIADGLRGAFRNAPGRRPERSAA